MLAIGKDFSDSKGENRMPYYVALANLTELGRKTIRSRPERIREVNKEVTAMGGKILATQTIIGQCL